MKRLDIPFNLSLMDLSKERLQAVKPVRVLDIFDGGTTNFHEEGLFSISIFGRVGSEERDTRFSYIDLRTEVFHPIVYRELCRLKQLYKGILQARAYAVWDPKEKDFVAADATTGDTGYHFFTSHWRDIVFKRTGSDIRDLRIEFITKWKDKAMTSKVLVIPAGLRDVNIDETGRVKEGEINETYRKLLSISNTVSTASTGNHEALNVSRNSMQMAFNAVYEYLESLVTGKGGFIQQKWGARRVFNGTRNVLTSMDTSPEILGQPNSPKMNHSVVGLYQAMKGTLPITKHNILNGWVSKVFAGGEGNAYLVNPVSLRRETVKVPPKEVDKWTTTKGLDGVINNYMPFEGRLRPVMVGEHYMGLVYRGPDHTFRIFSDIEELPTDKGFRREDVHPLTLCELLYISTYRTWPRIGMYLTRYPVAGVGSIYPTKPYVRNTVLSEMRMELDVNWERMGDDYVAVEYPVINEKPAFVETMSPHPSRLQGLVADFDGDTGSGNFVYTDEATAEIDQRLRSAAAYINPNGGLLASPNVETVQRVLVVMTGD